MVAPRAEQAREPQCHRACLKAEKSADDRFGRTFRMVGFLCRRAAECI